MKKKLNISLGVIFGSIVILYKYFIIIVAIQTLVLPVFLNPNLSREQRREIIDTFAGFENRGAAVFTRDNYIFLPDKRIEVTSIEYDGKPCYTLAGCGTDSFYAYTREKVDRKHINITLLEISYSDLEVTYIDTLSNLPVLNLYNNYYLDNKLYLGGNNIDFYVYDLDEKTYTTMPQSEFSAMSREQHQYETKILEDRHFFECKHYGVEITNKLTQEKKSITMDDLNGFPEGQYILSLKPYLTTSFFTTTVEKNGDIYILGMIELDTFGGMQSQNVVLKYDFENDTLTYHSSTYYNWDEIPQMIIV